MLSNAYIMVAIILIINIVYVTFSTLRMILTLKNRRYLAAFVSVFEITMYILGLSLVLDNLNEIQNIIAYAVGFGLGVIVGTKIEEKLALGYITVNVTSANPDIALTKNLREKGYGVTSWFAYGMEGDRLAMQILTPRKYELKLYEDIKTIDPRAFIISYEPKQIHGGFWVRQVRRGRLFNNKKKSSVHETTEDPTNMTPSDGPTETAAESIPGQAHSPSAGQHMNASSEKQAHTSFDSKDENERPNDEEQEQ